MRYDVFLGYSSADFDIATGFTRLEDEKKDEKNYILCIGARYFLPGSSVADCIVDGINTSKMAIFLLSDNSVKDEWCKFVLKFAYLRIIEKKLPKSCLLLVKITELPTEMSDIYNQALKNHACLDYSSKHFWRDLQKAIKKCMKQLN